MAGRKTSCLDAALRFLTYRPRSEAETRTRLRKQGFADEEIGKVIEHLKEIHLLDDTAFAEYWKENRDSFRPRSQRLLKLELRRKGLGHDVINAAVEDIDEAENAYRAALTKARTVPVADYQVFRQKLGGFLQRRGFGYGVVNQTLKRIWEEKTGNTGQSEDSDSQV